MKYKTSGFLNIILCLSVCFFAACNKESGPTTVNGTVRDVTTNVGVSNAEVGLFETDGESAFGLGGVLMEEKYSDASGEFIFNFNAREGYQYYVQAIKYQYWNDQSNNIEFVQYGEDDVIVYLQPEGYLELHIKNEPPSSPYDVISLNTSDPSNDGPFSGENIDTTIVLRTYGNASNPIVWGIYFIDSLTYTEELEIYTPAFDTTFFEILY